LKNEEWITTSHEEHVARLKYSRLVQFIPPPIFFHRTTTRIRGKLKYLLLGWERTLVESIIPELSYVRTGTYRGIIHNIVLGIEKKKLSRQKHSAIAANTNAQRHHHYRYNSRDKTQASKVIKISITYQYANKIPSSGNSPFTAKFNCVLVCKSIQ